jgi:Ca2+/Na+ antiporter
MTHRCSTELTRRLGGVGDWYQVGSNVFDIWLGLGLPWLLYLPFQPGGKLSISVDQLWSEILILVGVLVLYFVTIVCSGFKLTVRVGYVFMALYGVYIVYIIALVWLVGIYDR